MCRRWLKRLFFAFGTLFVLGIVLIVLFYTALVRTSNAEDFASLNDLPLKTWAEIPLSDDVKCSDGSDYHAYTRRGTSDNLLIHFAGGGMCWNGESCSQPIRITHFDGFYFPFIWEIFRATADGILKSDNADNPFADWNVVYLPYCTADFHTGTTTTTFPYDDSSVTIHFSGRQNVTEALDWIYANYTQPPKLLVSGESAGAFGSILWTPTIANHYTSSDVYQLADGAFIETPLWSQIVNGVWQADAETNFGFTVGDELAGDAYRSYAQTSPPNLTYLHINTLYDQVLMYFNAVLNGVTDDDAYHAVWSSEMRASMQAIAKSGLNYEFYLTDYGQSEDGTTSHTSISAPLFYEITQDGITLRDWLKRTIIDGDRFSVGSGFMDQ